jgi:hypothetical protein
MIKECDNTWACHELLTTNDDINALRVFCTHCKNHYIIKKDWRGVVDNVQYSKLFRKETLQPHQNLFYKYYPQYLKL